MEKIEAFALTALFNLTEQRFFLLNLCIILFWQQFLCSRWKLMRFTERYGIKWIINDIFCSMIIYSWNYPLVIVFYNDHWWIFSKLKDNWKITSVFNNLQKILWLQLQSKFYANCWTFLCDTKQSFNEIFETNDM